MFVGREALPTVQYQWALIHRVFTSETVSFRWKDKGKTMYCKKWWRRGRRRKEFKFGKEHRLYIFETPPFWWQELPVHTGPLTGVLLISVTMADRCHLKNPGERSRDPLPSLLLSCWTHHWAFLCTVNRGIQHGSTLFMLKFDMMKVGYQISWPGGLWRGVWLERCSKKKKPAKAVSTPLHQTGRKISMHTPTHEDCTF